MKYDKIKNKYAKEIFVEKDTQLFNFMKGEEYVNITKDSNIRQVVYNCYAGTKMNLYDTNELLYSIKFNYFHKGVVYDSCSNELGVIDGRNEYWTYTSSVDHSSINMSLFDFSKLSGTQMDIRVKISKGREYPVEQHQSEKPKAVGWFKHTLNFEYLNKHMKASQSNFKLYQTDNHNIEHTTMVSSKLKKLSVFGKKQYHCVFNINKLDTFIIFCIKNWSK